MGEPKQKIKFNLFDNLWGIIGSASCVLVGSLLGILYYYNFGQFYEAMKMDAGGNFLLVLSFIFGAGVGLTLGIIGLVRSETRNGSGKFSAGVSIILSILFLMVALLWLLTQNISALGM